jgi:glutathione synthase/RimK-type ligase-like ATP-grasp enzyme
MNPSVALVTCAEHPDLTADDRLVLPALERRGWRAVPALWDDPRQPWREYDAVVLRSTWDYHRRLPEFLGWLDRLEMERVPVHNGVATVRWNMRKTYLRDLEAAGTPVAGTVWAPMGSATALRDIAAATGWDTMVVKPVVSASAYQTWLVERAGEAADEERFARLLRERDLMVQPFLPAIATEGELSLVFIAGGFSHAVRKRPKPGDFRVQEEHGGTAEREEISPDLVRQAAQALAAAPEPPLYARVDGVVLDGTLMVMELELVEPMLYFGWSAASPARFVEGLAAAAAGRR